MKKRGKLLSIVLILLALTAAAVAWLFHVSALRGNDKEEILKTLSAAVSEPVAILVSGSEMMIPEPAAEHIYSHRGSAGLYEHSFRAYDDAIASGSRYIEQDLVISSDGVLFVSHDLSAYSMTGTDAAYSSMSAEEIDRLQTKAGAKVLRLSEVFDRYGRDINYVIELKTRDKETPGAVADLVRQYGLEDMVIVQSMSADTLGEMEELLPDVPKLFLCRTQNAFNSGLELPYADIISVEADAGLMTEENCKAAHERGKEFNAWTLDSEYSIKRAIETGVDTYFTNDTALAMRIETEYGYRERMSRARDRKNDEKTE